MNEGLERKIKEFKETFERQGLAVDITKRDGVMAILITRKREIPEPPAEDLKLCSPGWAEGVTTRKTGCHDGDSALRQSCEAVSDPFEDEDGDRPEPPTSADQTHLDDEGV
jgi:hypothetical protein